MIPRHFALIAFPKLNCSKQMFEPLLRVFLSTQNLSRRLDAIEAVYYLHLFSGNTRVNVATFQAAAAQLYGIISESHQMWIESNTSTH
jgi:hypothetical protein